MSGHCFVYFAQQAALIQHNLLLRMTFRVKAGYRFARTTDNAPSQLSTIEVALSRSMLVAESEGRGIWSKGSADESKSRDPYMHHATNRQYYNKLEFKDRQEEEPAIVGGR